MLQGVRPEVAHRQVLVEVPLEGLGLLGLLPLDARTQAKSDALVCRVPLAREH